ncbi:hypothetical protein BY996DRAFT_6463848 [Phakopsora pachyrhizi]|nr:hypothetical protein BY996DRAFT_6463848 [Phakopsora pachyrhizi]
METFKRMTVMILIILVITSLSWSYESGEVLGEADGELQVKGFTHPPDDQDFTWLIDDRHHQFGPHQSDSHSKAVETIEEIILTRIIQTFIYCSMEIRMNPLTTPVALSLLFTQNLINLTLIATLFQITNILMDKLGNNLINGFVENNHYIEPSNIPNVFETGVASNYFSPCANALYETTAINLVPTSIQSFRNHGKLVDHEKSGEGPVRDSIPNVKLHNDNLDLNLDYDSLAVDDLCDFSMEERRKKEGLRILELERLRTKNTKDSSQKFEAWEFQFEQSVFSKSGWRSQSKKKQQKTAFLKNENEPTNSYHVVNFKPAQLDDFERDEKVKFIIDIRAESRVMEELDGKSY